MERRKKRTRLQKRDGIQATLEGYRRFDYDYIPFGTYTVPDAGFKYRQGLFGRLCSGFIRGFLWLVAPVLLKVAYGCRVVGKEHLKALKGKGAMCVTNHISYLDTLFARAALGQFRAFYTMAPWNNKKGLGGWIMRHGGMWPFSPNLTATKHLMQEMERRAICKVLRENGGNISESARVLQMSRQRLQYRIKRYKINIDALLDNPPR